MEYTFKLTQEDVYAISTALGHRPYLEVFKVIDKMQAQIGEQEAARKAADEAAKAE